MHLFFSKKSIRSVDAAVKFFFIFQNYSGVCIFINKLCYAIISYFIFPFLINATFLLSQFYCLFFTKVRGDVQLKMYVSRWNAFKESMLFSGKTLPYARTCFSHNHGFCCIELLLFYV